MEEVARSALIAQMASTKNLNSWRCEVRNAFIGSIQGSLLPKVVRLARVWRALAIRVSVRWARGRECSGSYVSVTNHGYRNTLELLAFE